ncbi:MAG: hypothetical protein Q9191_004313 [Dirinaria sp. TL-2023a]
MPSKGADDADSSHEDTTPLVDDGRTQPKKETRWRERSLKRAKSLGKAGLQWTKQKASTSISRDDENRNQEPYNRHGKSEPSQTLVKANQIWTWVKGDNPLPDPKPPRQKRTYPRQDIHREDSIWVWDPKDVGAQIWEWIIGENPLTPTRKSAGDDTGKKERGSTPVQKISSSVTSNSLIGNINSKKTRTAWIWIKGDNPLSPPKPKRAKKSRKPRSPKMNFLKFKKREHKQEPAQITQWHEPSQPTNIEASDSINEISEISEEKD